jgi:hypothetical protein
MYTCLSLNSSLTKKLSTKKKITHHQSCDWSSIRHSQQVVDMGVPCAAHTDLTHRGCCYWLGSASLRRRPDPSPSPLPVNVKCLARSRRSGITRLHRPLVPVRRQLARVSRSLSQLISFSHGPKAVVCAKNRA